jgi:hypothetical protein
MLGEGNISGVFKLYEACVRDLEIMALKHPEIKDLSIAFIATWPTHAAKSREAKQCLTLLAGRGVTISSLSLVIFICYFI